MYETGLIYIIICLVSSVCMGAYSYFNNKNMFSLKKIFLVMSFFTIFVFSGIRNNVGPDFSNYIGNFIRISQYGERTRIEPGYWLLNKLTGIISRDPASIILITSLIITILLYMGILDISVSPALSIFFMFTLRDFEMILVLIRQAIALGIILISLKYILNNKFFSFFILIGLATSFHYSALVMLPLFAILNKKLTLKTLLYYFLFIFLIFVFRGLLSQLTSAAFIPPYYIELIQGILSDNAPIYIKQIIGNFGLLFLAMIKWEEIAEKSKYGTILINMQLVNCIFSISFLGLNLAYRFTIYFDFFKIFLVPLLLVVYVKDKNIRYLLIAMLGVFLLYRFYVLVPVSMYMPIPYQTIFN